MLEIVKKLDKRVLIAIDEITNTQNVHQEDKPFFKLILNI